MLSNYKRILIALDGSKQSEKAFNEMVEVAKRNSASVFIAWVINDLDLTTNAYSFSKIMINEEKFVKEYLEQKKQILKAAGIDEVTTIIEIGSAKRKIALEIPEEYHIDLIMMGSTGKGAITQTFVGSTTGYVVNHSVCNVLVVK